MRKIPLEKGETYHIFTRSIADFKIFNNKRDFERILWLIRYYRFSNDLRFSKFIDLQIVQKEGFNNALKIVLKDSKENVQIIAYCIMSTHIHLILKQLVENGISKFMNDLLNGYSKYFNIKYKRKGPLWESRFRSILINRNEYLLHLTRYIHLNPVTANSVDHPEDWDFSSYKEYINTVSNNEKICNYKGILEIDSSYRKFVKDRISYQRELAQIKDLIID
ncbi:MAG: transposase [Patescibacteria group bacterium]